MENDRETTRSCESNTIRAIKDSRVGAVSLTVVSVKRPPDQTPDPLKDPKNGTPQYEPITTLG